MGPGFSPIELHTVNGLYANDDNQVLHKGEIESRTFFQFCFSLPPPTISFILSRNRGPLMYSVASINHI